MVDISASFTEHHNSDFYLDKSQGHRLFNLQDLVDLSSLKNLSHLAKGSYIAQMFSVTI